MGKKSKGQRRRNGDKNTKTQKGDVEDQLQSLYLGADRPKCNLCNEGATNGVSVPCCHSKFCLTCLNLHRPYVDLGQANEKGCPTCGNKLPPTDAMIANDPRLSNWNDADRLKYDLFAVLESNTLLAAKEGRIGFILDFIGYPGFIDRNRLEAIDAMGALNLVHAAAAFGRSDLLVVLLQYGAKVDSYTDFGATPLSSALTHVHDQCKAKHYGNRSEAVDCSTLFTLLQWGADTTILHHLAACGSLPDYDALRTYDPKLVQLLESEFGGRRCEVIGLQSRPELNGEMCLIENYYKSKNRYKAVLESTGEVFSLSPNNLKRRDCSLQNGASYFLRYEPGGTRSPQGLRTIANDTVTRLKTDGSPNDYQTFAQIEFAMQEKVVKLCKAGDLFRTGITCKHGSYSVPDNSEIIVTDEECLVLTHKIIETFKRFFYKEMIERNLGFVLMGGRLIPRKVSRGKGGTGTDSQCTGDCAWDVAKCVTHEMRVIHPAVHGHATTGNMVKVIFAANASDFMLTGKCDILPFGVPPEFNRMMSGALCMPIITIETAEHFQKCNTHMTRKLF